MRSTCRCALACCATVLTLVGVLRAEPEDGTQLVGGTAPLAYRWEHVALTLDVDATLRGCPTSGEFSTWVDQLVGRAFVRPDASVRLVVTVRPTATGELLAELLLSATPAPRTLRQLRDRLGCEGLLRAVALSVSLLAELTPEAALPVPERPPPPSGSAVASTQPGPRPIPAAPAPPPSTVSLGPTQLPRPTLLSASEAEPASRFGTWSLTGFGLAAAGQNPGVGLGAGLDVRARFEAWSVAAGGAYLASTGTEAAVDDGAVRVEGPTAEALVAGCGHAFSEVWVACIQLGYWWMFARGYHFDHNRQALVRTAAVGAQLGATWAMGDAWRLATRIELFAPIQPVKLEAVGLAAPVWSMWPVVPRAAVALQWR